MSLTEKQIAEYREKLRDGGYMKRAIIGVAEKLSTAHATVRLPDAEPEINDTEEKEMAKNSLYDLNDHLFERIEWLTDQEITGEKLSDEIRRTEAVVKVSTQILNTATLLLRAATAAENVSGKMKVPAMLEDKSK